MTILAAVLDEPTGDVWVSTDEIATQGSIDVSGQLHSTKKWHRFGPWLLVRAGDVVIGGQWERHTAELAKCDTAWDVSDALIQILTDAGITKQETNGSFPDMQACGLLVRHGELWEFEHSLKPIRARFSVVGAGADVASGALWTARWLELPPLAQVEIAVLAASRLHRDCGGGPISGVVTRNGFVEA